MYAKNAKYLSEKYYSYIVNIKQHFTNSNNISTYASFNKLYENWDVYRKCVMRTIIEKLSVHDATLCATIQPILDFLMFRVCHEVPVYEGFPGVSREQGIFCNGNKAKTLYKTREHVR